MQTSPKHVTILLTAVGGSGITTIIDHLRAIPELTVRLVGVDAQTVTVGQFYLDDFFSVPYGDAPNYADVLLDICKKNEVDLIIPFSDQEAWSLSKARRFFQGIGCQILTSPFHTYQQLPDKLAFMNELVSHQIPTPQFYSPRNMDELDRAVAALGYPEKKIAFKPLDGHGSRGFRIIEADFDEIDHILHSKQESKLSLTRLKRILQERETFPPFMLMEYLAGNHWTAEALISENQCRYIIPQEKRAPQNAAARLNRVVESPEIEALVKRIAAAFDFEYLINLDLGINEQGEFVPYEINIRASAVIMVTAAAGCSLLELAVLQAFDIEKNLPHFREVDVLRFYQENIHTTSFGKKS